MDIHIYLLASYDISIHDTSSPHQVTDERIKTKQRFRILCFYLYFKFSSPFDNSSGFLNLSHEHGCFP